MTCIIAMHDPDEPFVHVVADQLIMGNVPVIGQCKIDRLSTGALVGFAGSVASKDIMLSLAKLQNCDFRDNASVRELFSTFQGICAYNPSTAKDASFWATMLVAFEDTLTIISSLGGITRISKEQKVFAIGTGANAALGAYHVLPTLNPEDRLRLAVCAASVVTPDSVSSSVDYLNTRPSTSRSVECSEDS